MPAMSSELLSRARRLEGFAARDPANVELLCDLADTYHRAGEHALALSALERAEQAGAAAVLLDGLRSRLLMALGRWHEAITLFEQALAQAPDSAPLLSSMGYSCWAAGDMPRAVGLLSQAMALEPANADIACQLALALEESGDMQRAAQVLEQALTHQPIHEKALTMLGRVKLDAGQLEDAAALAQRCIGAHPARAAGWQLRGQVALFQMDGAAATKSLRQALDLDPLDVDGQVLLAQASLLQGRVRHARTLLEGAAAQDPANDGALCMLGWACAAENDLEGAASAFERALAIAATADALAGRACVALGRGQREEAMQTARAALELEPEHLVARMALARAEELAGEGENAAVLLRGVLASTPFGPLGADVAATMRSAEKMPMVRRLQRRFQRAQRAAPVPTNE